MYVVGDVLFGADILHVAYINGFYVIDDIENGPTVKVKTLVEALDVCRRMMVNFKEKYSGNKL